MPGESGAACVLSVCVVVSSVMVFRDAGGS